MCVRKQGENKREEKKKGTPSIKQFAEFKVRQSEMRSDLRFVLQFS